MNTKNKSNILSIIFELVIVLYVIAFFIINFFGMDLIYDTDMYEDTLIAKMMWEQKSLFPDGWVFGNQYFVIATPVLSAMLYGITSNMNLSMKLATTLYSIFIMFCFIWAIYPIGKKETIMCGLMLMLSSIIGPKIGHQFVGQLFYLGVSYYSSYIVNVLLICGCLYRIKQNEHVSRAVYMLSMFVSFACGMQSLRQTIVIILPLLIYSVIDRKKEIIHFSIFTAIANIMGVLLIKLINPANVTIYGDISLLSIDNFFNKAFNCAYSVYQITGLRWLGKGYIIGVFALLLLFIVVVSIISSLSLKNGLNSIIILLSLSMLSIVGVCLVTNVGIQERFLFTWYPLVAFCCSFIVSKSYSKPLLKQTLTIALIIGSVFNLYYSYNEEISNSIMHNSSSEKDAVDWIIDNDYKYVYGKWLSMGKYMYYANGKVIGGAYDDLFHVVGYLNPQGIYSEENNKEAVYLIYSNKVEQCLNEARLRGESLNKIAEFGDGLIQLYTCEKQLMYK